MQVSYAKNPIQNEARPHKIQVHLASNGSQRQTTLILIIKSHWQDYTRAHTYYVFSTAYQQWSFLNNMRRNLGCGFDFCLEMGLDLGWKKGLVMWASHELPRCPGRTVSRTRRRRDARKQSGKRFRRLPGRSVLSLDQPMRSQLVEETCQFEVFSTLFQAEERLWKSRQSTGSRSFELCETCTSYQCGEKGHLSANCPQKVRRVGSIS